jgi:CheY-like chemotaxis protein
MSNASKRIRILIVEDNPSFQEIYEEILGANYHLEIVDDKEKAVSFLRGQIPDVAIIDMRLKSDERGNVDGLEIGQFIRDLGYKTIVILKSGFPTESQEITTRIKKLGIFRVLDKNADDQLNQLINAISDASLHASTLLSRS